MVNVKVISPANLGTEFTQVAPKIGLNLDASLVKAATGQIGLNRSVGIKRASQQASGTTLVNDAQLFLTMTPGYWLTDVFLKYTAGGRNDLKFDFNVESGAMAGTWQVDRSDNGTGNSTSAAIQLTSYALNNVFVAGGNGAVQNIVMMRGVIQVTTAGVLRFRFANNSVVAGQALATVVAGSILKSEFLGV